MNLHYQFLKELVKNIRGWGMEIPLPKIFYYFPGSTRWFPVKENHISSVIVRSLATPSQTDILVLSLTFMKEVGCLCLLVCLIERSRQPLDQIGSEVLHKIHYD